MKPDKHSSYGSHPIYLEHRYDELDNSAKSHGVFLFRWVNYSSRYCDFLMTREF